MKTEPPSSHATCSNCGSVLGEKATHCGRCGVGRGPQAMRRHCGYGMARTKPSLDYIERYDERLTIDA
jgi:hypothetical protein